MKKNTSLFVALALTFAILTPTGPALAGDPNSDAIQVAKAWFLALIHGDTAVATALSGVPFSFDRKQQILTFGEIRAHYDKLIQAKGARNIQPDSVSIQSSNGSRIEVIIMIQNSGMVVQVEQGEVFRVVGFWD